MSLGERLNTNQKLNVPPKNNSGVQPAYYQSNEAAKNSETLGVLDNILMDDEVSSVTVDGAKNIYIEKKGKIYKSTINFRDNIQLEIIMRRNAQNKGVEFDDKHPYVEYSVKTGMKLSAALPPITNRAFMHIKNYKDKFANFHSMQDELMLSKEMSFVLSIFSAIKPNIIILGKKNTLKTTLLSAILKKTPINCRGALIDNSNEFQLDISNITLFNIDSVKDEATRDGILNSVITSAPDKLYVNDPDKKIQEAVLDAVLSDFRGIIMTLNAKNENEAIDKLASILMEKNKALSFDNAKELILGTFRIFITVGRDSQKKKRILKISETNPFEGDKVKDVFVLNKEGEHISTGYIPQFFQIAKNSSLSIGQNIFDSGYKHTYSKVAAPEENKPAEVEEGDQAQASEAPASPIDDDTIKKAQEKFEELKKNAKVDTLPGIPQMETGTAFPENRKIEMLSENEINVNEQ